MKDRFLMYIAIIFLLSLIRYSISEYYKRGIEGEIEIYKQRSTIVYNTHRVLYHITSIQGELYALEYGSEYGSYETTDSLKHHVKELEELIEGLSRDVSYIYYSGKEDDLFRTYAHHLEVVVSLYPKFIDKVNAIKITKGDSARKEALDEAIKSGKGFAVFFAELDDYLDAEYNRISEILPFLISKVRMVRIVTDILFFAAVVVTAYMMFYYCKGSRGISTFIKAIKDGNYSLKVTENDGVCVKEVVSAFNTVMERIKEGEKESESMTITDSLTGSYNRRYFDLRIHEEVNRCIRYSTIFSLSLIDIDNFKDINDTFGHQVGDSVLKEVVNLIKQNVRDTDIVARYGGEEFAVIYPCTPKSGVLSQVERLRSVIGSHKFTDLERSVTVSIGAADSAGKSSPEQIIQEADSSLYMAKRNGRNCCVIVGITA